MDGGHPSCGGGDRSACPGFGEGRLVLETRRVAKQVTLSLARAWFIFGPDILGEKTPSALPGVSLLPAAGWAGASVRGFSWGYAGWDESAFR